MLHTACAVSTNWPRPEVPCASLSYHGSRPHQRMVALVFTRRLSAVSHWLHSSQSVFARPTCRQVQQMSPSVVRRACRAHRGTASHGANAGALLCG